MVGSWSDPTPASILLQGWGVFSSAPILVFRGLRTSRAVHGVMVNWDHPLFQVIDQPGTSKKVTPLLYKILLIVVRSELKGTLSITVPLAFTNAHSMGATTSGMNVQFNSEKINWGRKTTLRTRRYTSPSAGCNSVRGVAPTVRRIMLLSACRSVLALSAVQYHYHT